MKRAAIYCRVSTKEQLENLSLATQEASCRAYCQSRDLEVVEIFVEEGESAKTADRTQLRQLVDFCRARKGQIDVVVVYALSRFSRNTPDHIGLRQELAKMQVTLRSATEPIDDTKEGKLLETVLIGVAQYDNEARAERTRDGMRKSQEMGRWVHSAPLGYKKGDGRTGPSLLPDADSAEHVAELFTLYSTGRYSLTDLAARAQAMGLRGRGATRIRASRLRVTLRNPIYAGILMSKVNQLECEGDWQPIVPKAVFDKVQVIMANGSNGKTRENRNHPDFPLRGLLRCALCGTAFTGSHTKGRARRYPYYRCIASCKGVSARQEHVHLLFRELLTAMRPTPGLMRLFRGVVLDVWNDRRRDAQRARQKLAARVDGLLATQERLVELFAAGKLDEEPYQRQRLKLREDILAARVELQGAQDEEINIEDLLDFAEYAISNAARLWDQFDVKQKKRFQALLFPEGLPFDGDKFGTAKTSPVFQLLEPSTSVKDSLASPTGRRPERDSCQFDIEFGK